MTTVPFPRFSVARPTARAVLVCWLACLPLAAAGDGGVSKHFKFGLRIAGLYLAVGPEDAHVFQIGADGQFVYTESEQFTGFSGGPAFGDELGTWRRVGRRSLVSTSLHLGYWPDGSGFTGTTVLRRTFEFERRLRRFTVTCTGTTYLPGVDPFDPTAEPESSFECPPREFERVLAGS